MKPASVFEKYAPSGGDQSFLLYDLFCKGQALSAVGRAPQAGIDITDIPDALTGGFAYLPLSNDIATANDHANLLCPQDTLLRVVCNSEIAFAYTLSEGLDVLGLESTDSLAARRPMLDTGRREKDRFEGAEALAGPEDETI